jgi:DNA polymerase-3 subunit beta
MKLSCLQENLSKGLGIVGRAVATRSTLPITQNVLISADKSRVKLAATNLEIAITYWISAKVAEQGEITVPARLLTDFVNSLPNDKIDMSLSDKTKTLDMKCARFSGRINGMAADEFPPIPAVGDGPTAIIDPEALRSAISQVVFAAATEETRPVLTGVYCEFHGDTLTMAAADGFRLAVHKTPLNGKVKERVEIIIPARTLNELQRLLTEEKEPVSIIINSNKSQVMFRLKEAEVVSQLIQGSFPNYKQLVPESCTTSAEMSLAEFTKATKTTSIFAREGSAIVRLQIAPGQKNALGQVVLSARAEEVGEDTGDVDAVVTGEEAKIAFNSKYLADALSVLHTERVLLEITGPSSPGVLKPIGDENYIHVVMPMFVQW